MQRDQEHQQQHDHHQLHQSKEVVSRIRSTEPRDRRKSCMCTMHRARVSRSRIKMEVWIRVLHRSCPFSVITFCVLTRGSLEALAHADYFSYGQSRTTQPAPPCGHTTGEYFLLYKRVSNKGLLTCSIVECRINAPRSIIWDKNIPNRTPPKLFIFGPGWCYMGIFQSLYSALIWEFIWIVP